MVPEIRIKRRGRAEVNLRGDYVLYWMFGYYRTRYNYSLDRAIELAHKLHRPLFVLISLPSGLRWDTDRSHAFAVSGMIDVAKALRRAGVKHCLYVERSRGDIEKLVMVLSARASAVVTDHYRCGEYDDIVMRTSAASSALFESVDSHGLMPCRAAVKIYPTAASFRCLLQKELPARLAERPCAYPLARLSLPRLRTSPCAASGGCLSPKALSPKALPLLLSSLPIDHSVSPLETRGGMTAAADVLASFVKNKLSVYAAERNDPDADATSALSPYLRWGHISVHEVAPAVLAAAKWTPEKLAKRPSGRSAGWWGAGANAEAFLDELVTWRELGFNMTAKCEDYDTYEGLPAWAQTTLDRHSPDRREYVYDLARFESASTHDPLWNAAQRQLVREGRIHNYMRMLWGKKILEWSSSPREALAIMLNLNNRYALDGCDPNSYSGIFWILGRYDRPWGPERPVLGKIRYMSSDNTTRKVKVAEYLRRYGP